MSRTPRPPTAPPHRRDQRRPTAPTRPLTPPAWFAGRLLAVLTGTSPITTLAGYLRPSAYDRLWHLMNTNPAWSSWARLVHPAVHHYRVTPVAPGVLEVTATVHLTRERVRIIAFRLEHTATQNTTRSLNGWHCTAVEAP